MLLHIQLRQVVQFQVQLVQVLLELLILLQKVLTEAIQHLEQLLLLVAVVVADTQVQVQDYLEDPEAEVVTQVQAVVQHKQVFQE